MEKGKTESLKAFILPQISYLPNMNNEQSRWMNCYVCHACWYLKRLWHIFEGRTWYTSDCYYQCWTVYPKIQKCFHFCLYPCGCSQHVKCITTLRLKSDICQLQWELRASGITLCLRKKIRKFISLMDTSYFLKETNTVSLMPRVFKGLSWI